MSYMLSGLCLDYHQEQEPETAPQAQAAPHWLRMALIMSFGEIVLLIAFMAINS